MTFLANLIINILNYNQQPPEFDFPWTPNLPFIDLTTQEEEPKDTYITTIVAIDPDGPGIERYQIIDNPGNHFQINSNTGKLFFFHNVTVFKHF